MVILRMKEELKLEVIQRKYVGWVQTSSEGGVNPTNKTIKLPASIRRPKIHGVCLLSFFCWVSSLNPTLYNRKGWNRLFI